MLIIMFILFYFLNLIFPDNVTEGVNSLKYNGTGSLIVGQFIAQ